jgi:hypothetical protein
MIRQDLVDRQAFNDCVVSRSPIGRLLFILEIGRRKEVSIPFSLVGISIVSKDLRHDVSAALCTPDRYSADNNALKIIVSLGLRREVRSLTRKAIHIVLVRIETCDLRVPFSGVPENARDHADAVCRGHPDFTRQLSLIADLPLTLPHQ